MQFQRKVDRLSTSPELLFQGRNRFSSFLGMIMTILCYSGIAVIGIWFFYDWINNAKVQVVANYSIDETGSVDMNAFPVAFIVYNNVLQPIPEAERVYSVMPTQGDTSTKYMFSIAEEKCDINKHFGDYKHLFEKVDHLKEHYCIPLNGKHNYSLHGFYGARSEINFNIDFTKCKNGTNKDFLGALKTNVTNCLPPEQLKAVLNEVFIEFLFIDFQINNDNENPFTPVLKSMILPASTSIFKRYFLYRKLVDYTSDKGIMMKDESTIRSFQFDFKDTSVDLSSELLQKFAQITMPLSGTKASYHRTYPKIQQIFANIGGITSTFLTLSTAIVHFFTKTLFYLEYTNVYYNFEKKSSDNDFNNNNSKIHLTTNGPLQLKNTQNNVYSYNKWQGASKKEMVEGTKNGELKWMCRSFFCPTNMEKDAVRLVKEKISLDNILREILKFETVLELIMTPEQKEIIKKVNIKNIKKNFFDQQYENIQIKSSKDHLK